MKLIQRRQLLVDPIGQAQLMRRPMLYWLFAPVAILLFAVLRESMVGPETPFTMRSFGFWYIFGLAAATLILPIPLLVYDLLTISNRMVGPYVRLRRALRELAQGRIPRPLDVRQGDYFHELYEDFNTALAVYRMQHEGICTASTIADETDLREHVEANAGR